MQFLPNKFLVFRVPNLKKRNPYMTTSLYVRLSVCLYFEVKFSTIDCPPWSFGAVKKSNLRVIMVYILMSTLHSRNQNPKTAPLYVYHKKKRNLKFAYLDDLFIYFPLA